MAAVLATPARAVPSSTTARNRMRDFQQALAERLRQPAAAVADTLLAVHAGAEGWLLQLDEIGAIHPVPAITPVPLTQPWFRGATNLRGVLTSVVDLVQFAGGPAQVADKGSRLITLASPLRCNVALLVSELAGLRHGRTLETLAAPQGAAQPSEHAAWRGAALREVEGQVWLPLSLQALVRLPAFLDASLVPAATRASSSILSSSSSHGSSHGSSRCSSRCSSD